MPKKLVETPFAITERQYEIIERALQAEGRAKAAVILVYETILAAHDVSVAEIVRIDGDVATGRTLVVCLPEKANGKQERSG